jgi:Protein of unknown function (DUF2510)
MHKPSKKESQMTQHAPHLFCWVFFAVLGGLIAHYKNRKVVEGALWGALLGVIGVIIVCFLKKKPKIAHPPFAGWYPDPDGGSGEKYWDGYRWSAPVHDVR